MAVGVYGYFEFEDITFEQQDLCNEERPFLFLAFEEKYDKKIIILSRGLSKRG